MFGKHFNRLTLCKLNQAPFFLERCTYISLEINLPTYGLENIFQTNFNRPLLACNVFSQRTPLTVDVGTTVWLVSCLTGLDSVSTNYKLNPIHFNWS